MLQWRDWLIKIRALVEFGRLRRLLGQLELPVEPIFLGVELLMH